jgi:hypothetical protein
VTSKQAAPRDINRNEVECLRRVGEKLPLTPAQRTLLDREIAALKAELSMMDAYEALSRQEFDQAAEQLAQANSHYRDKRIKLAVYALRIFPRWTARYLQTRRKEAGGNC